MNKSLRDSQQLMKNDILNKLTMSGSLALNEAALRMSEQNLTKTEPISGILKKVNANVINVNCEELENGMLKISPP